MQQHPIETNANPISAYNIGEMYGGGKVAHRLKYNESDDDAKPIDDDLFNRLFAYVADIKITRKRGTKRSIPNVSSKTRRRKRG